MNRVILITLLLLSDSSKCFVHNNKFPTIQFKTKCNDQAEPLCSVNLLPNGPSKGPFGVSCARATFYFLFFLSRMPIFYFQALPEL